MKYRISNIIANASNTANASQYSISGSSIKYPSNQSMSVDITLEIEEYRSDEVKDIESFEAALNGLPSWCTSEMAEKALKKMYPEYYV